MRVQNRAMPLTMKMRMIILSSTSWKRIPLGLMIPGQSLKYPEKEKKVLVLYYYEELTLKEIGRVLAVTESRVSQLHTKAIIRLRARLTNARRGII